MPIYDYICSKCGQRTEVIHGIYDAAPRFCPSCGAEGTLRKAFSTPAILFKGSGWAKKDRAATRTPASSGSADKSDKRDRDKGSDTGSEKGSDGAKGAGASSGDSKDSASGSTPSKPSSSSPGKAAD